MRFLVSVFLTVFLTENALCGYISRGYVRRQAEVTEDENGLEKDEAMESCYKRIKDEFKKSNADWISNTAVEYDKEGHLLKAPLSLACFDQCYFAAQNLANERGIPSADKYEAYINATEDDVFLQGEYLQLKEALEEAQQEHAAETLKLVDVYQDVDKVPKSFDAKACQMAITYDIVMNRKVSNSVSDQQALANLFYVLSTVDGEELLSAADDSNSGSDPLDELVAENQDDLTDLETEDTDINTGDVIDAEQDAPVDDGGEAGLLPDDTDHEIDEDELDALVGTEPENNDQPPQAQPEQPEH